MSENNKLDHLQNFLEGNFHQDIDSVESAIQEILEEESKEYLEYAVEFINDFLNGTLSKEEKEDFIVRNTYIYFDGLGENPVTWLEKVQKCIIEKLKEE